MNVPHQLQHPASPTKEWDKFAMAGITTTARRIEENGFPGRTAKHVMVRGSDDNDANVSIGPDQDADMFPVSPGETVPLPSEGGPFTMGEWWIKSTSGTQAVKVLYQ